jgi:hypothetical protein
MSRVGPEGRSYAKLGKEDLRRLAALALADRNEFFSRHPDWARFYRGRVLCTALCQGAAQHYVRGDVGINDFDVYTFYATHPKRAWYAKRRGVLDFGDSKFGRSIDKPKFVGRRVDLLGRGIPATPRENPKRALLRYLQTSHTKTARLLAEKAVVLLEPSRCLGEIIWPPDIAAV